MSAITHTLVPNAPKILEIKPGPEPESYTSICVKWDNDTKAYNRGSDITGFVVECHNTSDLSDVVKIRVRKDVFSKTLKGLKPSCKYNVMVSAKNAVGTSEPSTRPAGPRELIVNSITKVDHTCSNKIQAN